MTQAITTENNTLSLSEGYKHTDVGLIPSDWDIHYLGNVCNLINGRGFKPYEWSREGLPIIRIQNLNGSDDFNYFDGDFNTKILINDGQLLFAWSGSRGTSFGPHIWYGDDALLNYHTWKMVIKEGIESKYFFHALKALTKVIEDSAHGASALVHTQMGEMKKFLMPIPRSYEEQTIIANALSDVDALLSELEKLIAKKQEIKTATMQQLLTGKARLPQFSTYTGGDKQGQIKGTKSSELGEIPEDWGVLSIGECSIKVGSGKTPKGGSSVYVDSGRPFVRSQNIGWGQLRLSDLSYITEEIHQTFSGSEIKTDDVLLNITGASIGRCALANQQIEKGNVNQHVCIIRLNSKKVKPYILQALVNSELGQNQIDSYQAGGNREGLNFSQVKNLKFPFSSIPKEQIAIATILSDMDEEIQALKQRLSKTRQIKQGMMQELLTGRTRLPFEKE
ncbi:restriction endonuclease subunit S [Vibrio splendidus]|uniref:restriction endonuclease subunit S n=1 Tax=Vibrio TaxID=662 RepID=UPI00246839C3|nr:restriction endonuclease subunit S [Vibrio splendidus]MDH5938666.1 restriction endonuclease subunit S [Vibrio splendidus]